MKKHRLLINKTALILAGALLVSSAVVPADARERGATRRVQHVERRAPHHTGHHYQYRYRHGNYYRVSPLSAVIVGALIGEIVLSLPAGHRTIVCSGEPYYYYDGIFYHRHEHGYRIVSAPRVRYLPKNARRVIINNEVYFTEGNQYYCLRGTEYEVCPPPVYPQEAQNPTTTIMITNSNGSRTPVALEQLGQNQWRGPRGEIYDGLPTDEQLQEGYGF